MSRGLSNRAAIPPEQLRLSEQAVRRYRERVKPALDFDSARTDLEAVIGASGEIAPTTAGRLDPAHSEMLFVVFGASVAPPIARDDGGEPLGVSCLADSAISATHEQGRHGELRGGRRQARRAR
jgi:hypothetical protein